MIHPEVTVMMTVYNAEKYLEEAISSILTQSFKNFELLIINDGSTDASLDIISSFTDDRIHIIDNGCNRGLFYSRQLGLSSARAPLIAILDADDVAFSDRLQVQVDLLNALPEVAICSGRALYINEKGEPTGESEIFPENANARMLFGNVLVNSAVMFRTKWAREIGGYHPFDLAEDYDLGLRLALKHPVYCINRILVKYRVHGTNTSFRSLEGLQQALASILSDMHQQLGISDSDALTRAHLFYFFRDQQVNIDDFYQLFTQIKASTRNNPVIDQQELAEEIFIRWAEAILLFGDSRSLALLFDKKLLYKPMLTAKMIRRAFKRSVKSLFK